MINRIIIVGVLALCSLMNSAIARPVINCVWDSPNFFPLTTPGYKDVISSAITQRTEQYNCNQETGQCSLRYYYTIPNQTFTVTASNTVTCINNGDEVGKVDYHFYRNAGPTASNYRDLRMTLAGGGSNGGWITLDGRPADNVVWGYETLEPCQTGCTDVRTGWPRYHQTLTLTFTTTPNSLSSYTRSSLEWNNQDYIGNFAIDSQNPSVVNRAVPICLFTQSDTSCGRYVGGIGGGGGLVPVPPPIPQCTLRIVTPNIIEFQPISSDDLSRNRVRMEDFTLTATKGPVQSDICIGNVYNLPGEIKTEGGYAISNIFWGINHSSGTAQGIGLKIYDLDLGSYLQFNYRYPSFIKNIRTVSETRRFRAEIAASTNDLNNIKSGEYSQVLTFEVRIP